LLIKTLAGSLGSISFSALRTQIEAGRASQIGFELDCKRCDEEGEIES
jgi:hypothetical protein